MDFNEWVLAVERQLKLSGRNVRIQDVDPEALRSAFEVGESPVLFAKRESIPIRDSSQRAVKVRRSMAWLVFPVALIPLAVTFRYLNTRLSEEHGWDALTRRRTWPVSLPFTTASVKGYVPGEATQVTPEVQEFVKSKLLDPSAASFQDTVPIAVERPGSYLFEGKVESVNQYGTRVLSAFRVRASRPVRVNHGLPGQKSSWTVLDEKWKFEAIDLGRTLESNVWSEVASGGMVRPAAKKSAPKTLRRE